MSEKTDFLIIKQIIEATDQYQKQMIDYETNDKHLILYSNAGCVTDYSMLWIAFLSVGYTVRLGYYFNPVHKTHALIVYK